MNAMYSVALQTQLSHSSVRAAFHYFAVPPPQKKDNKLVRPNQTYFFSIYVLSVILYYDASTLFIPLTDLYPLTMLMFTILQIQHILMHF